MGKKTKLWQRWLSLVLAIYMGLSNVPLDALAQETEEPAAQTEAAGQWEDVDTDAPAFLNAHQTEKTGPVITKQPTDVKVKMGEAFCVSVEAEGEGLLYEWYGREANGTFFKSSITDNTYDTVMTAARAGRQVYCVITDAYGNSVTTNTVKILLAPTYIWEQWIQPVTMAADTHPTYGGSSTGYYSKGQTFGGILYSTTFREGRDVLWNLNSSTYYSAVANPASLLYTTDYRGRVFNESAWAGSVCSTTALKACGYAYPYTTAEIPLLFDEKTDHSIDNLEFGDMLWTKGHVAGVVGVNAGADGQVASVTVIEQASQVKVFEVTAANWDSYFAGHWTNIYRGDFDKTRTAPEDYPENLSIIFERGNNTYVTDTETMLFYIPTATTVYVTKDGSTTQHAKNSFPTQTVNGVTVYDLASLFTGIGDYYFHTEENTTDICIKVIDKGSITISGTTATLNGYENCEILGYRVIKILEKNESTAYNFFDAPDGYTSEAVNLSFRWLSGNTFAIENIPEDAAGWKLEVFYDTGYGWARAFSENRMNSDSLTGKTLSILGASISTFDGTSNGAAADTTNSTIRNNVKYYPNTTIPEVTLGDTWWMQVAEDLGLRLLVNNAWSGSSLLYERNGTVGAYVDRCVQLHDDTGDNAGEMPDIIGIQMGTNDFQYYKDTLGTADIDYDALIKANGDGTYTYAAPVTSLEAAAIVLHKISVRYPDAEVYYLNISQRVDNTDELIRSFNADLRQVVEHFGAHIVDIYGSAITMDSFDTYIGDGRVHPNCLGMDAYTEAFKKALLANTGYCVTTHTVSLELDGVTADYGDDKIVVSGDAFTVNLTAGDSLEVKVTMGGADITEAVYADGTVTIPAVTADVVITAKSVYAPKSYRWEFNGTDLVGENTLTKTSGTTTDGVFSKTSYSLKEPVVLNHDQPWVVEWKCKGTFLNANGSSGARVFTSDNVNANYNARYIFKSNTDGLIAMGEKTTTGSHNYGIALADHGIDWTAEHTYRLENRIAADGSNMVWLYVDGEEIGPMVHYHVGTTDKNTTSDWLSGKDFRFPYMGTDTHGFTNASIAYIQVWEGGLTHAVPESQGVQNAIARAYALTDVEWTPKKDVPGVQKIDGAYTVVPFKAGVTYKGIPYSGVIATDTYVGLNVSLESFLTALENENSVLYTENLYSTNPKSATYFGTVCSKFAQYVLDVPGSFNTNNVANIPGMETVAMPGEYTLEQVKLGDVILDVVYHTAVCTDLLYDARGNVAYIEISEAVMPVVRRKLWTPEEFYAEFADYRLCRYAYLDSVPAVPSSQVRTSYALMPRLGDKYNYPVSTTKGVVDVLESGYSTAVILRDGAVAEEIALNGAASFSFDRTVPGKLEMYLVKADGSRSGSVYANVVESSVVVTNAENYANGKLTVSFSGSSGTPLYVQVGSGQSVFCSIEGKQDSAELSFALARVSSQKVRVAYQNAYGIYLSAWVGFTADTNPSDDPLLSQGQYWDGQNITPGSHIPAVQEGKEGHWTYTMVPVEPGTTYYSQGATRLWYLDEKGQPISTYNAYKDSEVPFQFTTPENAAYVSIAYSPKLVEKGTESLLKEETLSLRYDDHVDISGKEAEIIDSGEAVVAIEGDYLVAAGIGTAVVKIDGILYEVTVEKTKVNLVMVIGQSNSGNHFPNATSAVTCPIGTAYYWNYGATEPEDYTQPSMGFHAPLLAELYAQSAAAGDPVKNVLIWAEGYTSKNGQSITAWAVEQNGVINTEGTDGAAQMMRDCLAYYEGRSDKYEIINKVVFCNHGTTDHKMDPQRYTKLFTAMWERLKAEGMEYLAFLRVRGAHALNTTENVDVYYYGIPSAQLEMVRSREDMFMASTLAEGWTGPASTSHSIDVRKYITVMETYGQSATYSDSYGNKASFADGVLTTTMKELYGSNNKVHYGIFGYGLIGADAAYNMYHALRTDDFTIVQGDTAGFVQTQTVSANGTTRTIDITGMTDDLIFYPGCGSAAGTMEIRIMSGEKNVTDDMGLLHTTGDHYGAVDVEMLKQYEDVAIVAQYTTANGTGGSVTYQIERNAISLRYDDHVDMSGKEAEIVDAGKPTSYQVGYGVEENKVPDTAVVTLEGNYLVATGIGTARVRMDGVLYEISVEPAPISLFMITGHSMGAGQNGTAAQSVVGHEGQVYSSHGTSNLSSSTSGVGISYAAATKAKNINAFTAAGTGSIGEGSALAWQWNSLTGEKVWVLNTAVGGTCLAEWIPGKTNYKNAVTQFQRAQAILANEIQAGHYTLSHMGILYHNGANFSYKGVEYTQEDLKNWYDAMWNGFKSELSRDMDGNGSAETVSFLGLVPIWTKSAGISYTQDEPAGLYMAASDAYSDIFTASVIGQDWLTNADVAAKFPEITYTTQDGNAIIRPTTTAGVFSSDNVHYLQVGYNAVGIDLANNLYARLKGEPVAPTIGLLINDGKTEVADTLELNYGVPVILSPVTNPITAGGLTFEVSGCVKMEYPLQITATGNGTGTLTVSSGETVLKTVTFTCNDAPAQPLSLRYDDHYDISGKEVEIVDAGKPTSYRVGYGVEENKVPDTAVVTVEGNSLVATGIGTARVRIDGQLYEVTVEAAPISLLLLAGQSNMRGSEGNAAQSIVCPEGMVYATYGDDRGADNTAMTAANAAQFAPSALTGAYSGINVTGTTDCLSGYPVYSLTEDGAGKIGPDSGFAYEWVKSTGEKVWIVNAAHGGTSISVWQPGKTEYEECQALFTACTETLRKEIAAGHFTLSHMAYFWCQGCSDRTQSAQWYVQKYLAMHEGFKTELAFDHDSNAATADKTFEFGGIIPVRVGSTAACYRDGVSSYTNSYAYHESFVDLRFSGPRVAQYWMINNPELTDIWGVCDIGDSWVWMPDGTNGVADYFQSHYENGTVDYTTQVAQKVSWYTPTTPKAVHDSIHYNQIGYNEVGRESVRNALILLGETEAPQVEATVELMSWDGITPAEEIKAWTSGCSDSLVVPMVSPIWKAKEMTYTVTDGLRWEYYDLLADTAQTEGVLTAGTGETVAVVKQDPGAYFADHLSQLPEKLCLGVNLWNVLEHDPMFYTSGTHWGTHSSGNVYSVTIPVQPGDKIFATAFGKVGENGHATTSGIRCTFFGEYAVVKTLDPGGTYAEFSKNGGYLVVPEGAVAMNIPMWTGDDTNELYILNLPHDRTEGICGICGKDSHIHSWGDWEITQAPTAEALGVEQRKCACGETESREVEGAWQKYALADHMQEMPESYCAGTNLWAVLEHDVMYFASGTSWGKYSGGGVCSVTIPVQPGDKIYATAFGKAGENGHATSSGIRCTFFDDYGVCKTMNPAGTYAEFSANGGYLVAPEGAVAFNVPMWNGSDENELYILNAPHSYGYAVEQEPTADTEGVLKGICTGCGAETTVTLPVLSEDAYDYAVTKEPAGAETGLATYTWKDTTYGNFSFEVVLEVLPILYGDVNGDGTVNNKDRLVLTRYLAKWTDYPEEIINMAAADVNGDGKVNNLDRLILTRHLAKWTGYEELPYKQ